MGQPADPRGGYIAIATARFAHAGYHGTSLADVARSAGVTKQALLHFFGTKERLYAEVLTALAQRQRAQIYAAAGGGPAAQLASYFSAFAKSARSDPDDARLVVRALLDSPETARTWPMKPYLDALMDLSRAAQQGRGVSETDQLAWISHVIGAILYLAISAPAVSGMYGKSMSSDVEAHLEASVMRLVRRGLHLPD